MNRVLRRVLIKRDVDTFRAIEGAVRTVGGERSGLRQRLHILDKGLRTDEGELRPPLYLQKGLLACIRARINQDRRIRGL